MTLDVTVIEFFDLPAANLRSIDLMDLDMKALKDQSLKGLCVGSIS